MNDRSRPFTVVITGDSIAPEAGEILAGKCRTVFSGPYPAPDALARMVRDEQADALNHADRKVGIELSTHG
jgi:hypothetical protein